MLLVIAQSICHTATCTNSAILSAIARLPSIKCSLQEATYLSKGKTVVCPVVSELASSFNWCGSQNLVVSVALSSSYVRFVHTSPVTHAQCSIFHRRQVCSSVSSFEGVFDITSTYFYGENSVDQSGAGYIIPIPQSPWIYRGKPPDPRAQPKGEVQFPTINSW